MTTGYVQKGKHIDERYHLLLNCSTKLIHQLTLPLIVKGVPASHLSGTLGIVRLEDMKYQLNFIVVLMCPSLIINELCHIFLFLLAIHYLLISFAHFFSN